MEESAGTVLVVDDEEPIRRVISRTLEQAGYHCTQAGNGQEALEKASSEEFDVVLLDIKMPGMSGIELLPQLTFANPDICVVMSTAVNDTQTAVEAMNLGAYDYILKPFDLDALKMKVDRALERKALLEENRDFRLQQVEHRYEALVGNLADAVIGLHRGLVSWCNDQVEGVLGYTQDELTGTDALALFPEDVDGRQAMAVMEEGIREKGRVHGRVRARRKDGEEIYIGYSASAIEGKEPMEIMAVLRDVTEDKDLESKLQRLHEEMEALSGLLPICVSCGGFRDDADYRKSVEDWLKANPESKSSTSLCVECAGKEDGKRGKNRRQYQTR